MLTGHRELEGEGEKVLAATAPNIVSPTWRVLATAALFLLLSGSAYSTTVALASPDHRWAGWGALLPLFISIRLFTPPWAMLAGAFWGASLYIWMMATSEIGIAPGIVSLSLLTGVPAAYTYLGARLTRQVGFSPYLLALGWMGVELAMLPLGLHRGLLVGAQGDGLLIHWIGNFAGCVLLAFLVAYVSASVFEALSRVRVGIGPRRLAFGPLGAARRILPQEAFSSLFHFSRATRPRAPPALIA